MSLTPLDISAGITGWYDGYSYDNSNSVWKNKLGSSSAGDAGDAGDPFSSQTYASNNYDMSTRTAYTNPPSTAGVGGFFSNNPYSANDIQNTTYTVILYGGYTAKLTGWTHLRDYAKSFLRNSGTSGASIKVEDLVQGEKYAYRLYSYGTGSYVNKTHNLKVNGTNWNGTDGNVTQTDTGHYYQNPSATGEATADSNGEIEFSFVRSSSHVQVCGLVILPIGGGGGSGVDLSGTDITGTLTPSIYHTPAHLVSYRNNKKYMQKMFKYIAGSITSRINFPTGFLADTSYTLFHVARRDPNGTDLNGRIFDGNNSNWYSGFSDASSGVTGHDLSYVNTTDRKYGNNWVVSVDRPNYYRSIGYSDFSSGYYDISSGSRTDNASPSSVPQLTINNGSTTEPLAISNLISTGGIKTSYIYNNETYITHTFLSDGSFTVIGAPISADVLVVGAGGHGGSGGGGSSVGDGQGRTNGGGGGAGQLYYNTHTLSGDIYNIIIGESGENSKIISPTYTSLVIDASGGGSGGQYPNNTDNDNGQPGGSGGGSCGHTASGGTADARSSVNGPYYGNNGGSCSQAHTQFYTYGAGGGGADASGNDGTTKTIYDANTNINFCDGGDGKLITIRYGQPGSTEHSQTPPAGWDTGDVQYYAGGGGGSAPPYGGDGGKGGGGRGDNTDSQWGGTPVAGTTNTGGGGGGRRGESGGHGGASGGSGIVIIRYKINASDLSGCDWNVAEVFAYNKHLSGSEEDSLADYLKFKYLGTNQVSTGNPYIYQLTHDISAVDASNTQQMIKGLPPDISAQTSIIGWYTPESYNIATNPGFWTDVTGQGNDLSNCGTSPEFVDKDSTYNWISYIKGSKGSSYSDASGFIFPENLLPTDGAYTIIHVSRRVKDASGNATGRIFDSASNKNFYSGFVGSKSGVALHSVDVSASG